MDCEKCKVTMYGVFIELCPLHAAAEELLEFAKSFVSRWRFPKKPKREDLQIYLDEAMVAIAKAEGGN